MTEKRISTPYLIGLLLSIITTTTIHSQTFKEWHDPAVNQINRAPMRATFFAYESAELATTETKENSSHFMSLNGPWKFSFAKDADKRPVGFFKPSYNDSEWDDMEVPGIWEVNGYGDPIYVNRKFAWHHIMDPEPPKVPTKENYVGSYRRTVDIPSDWNGKEVFINMGAVSSAVYLWVNGQFVGYSEDRKLEPEFDITSFLKKGKNQFAFQVFRWCDGTYVELQDFWRLAGTSRDMYIYARHPLRINDISIQTDLDETYKNSTLNIQLDINQKKRSKTKGSAVLLELTNSEGKIIWRKKQPLKTDKQIHINGSIENISAWSAELPVLYTLTTTLLDPKNNVVEVIPQRVGFRKVEIKNGLLLVNGQPILIKGVYRHEMDPDNAYYLTRQKMEDDVRIMKLNNINAVRTCHYPNDPYFYKLCDIYGLYVVDEANIEAHGYEEIAKMPSYTNTHLERATRMIERDKNSPSVIIWSMGNESGYGLNFVKTYKKMKALDETRPVQYQRSGMKAETDIFVPFYKDYQKLEAYGKKKDQRMPLIQCEYAHAMGNSMGGFKDYWDLYRKYDNLQGGFIWDFADQSFRDYNNGKMTYTYGGDYGQGLPSDNNFLNNGLVNPDRQPNPHLDEVAMIQQSIWTKPINLEQGKISVFNENFFASLKNTMLVWKVVEEGFTTHQGVVSDLNVEAQKTVIKQLPYRLNRSDKERFLEVYYKTKKADGIVPAGHTVAREQFPISNYEFPNLEFLHAKTKVKIENTKFITTLNTDKLSIIFDKKTGYIIVYKYAGEDLIQKGESIKPNFWRGGTDNDYGARFQIKLANWRNPISKLKSMQAININGSAEVTVIYELNQLSAQLKMTYLLNGNGTLKITETLVVSEKNKKEMPILPRFGMQIPLKKVFNQIHYYGRGPIENYADRKTSAFINSYKQSVSEQFYPYIRPQETGTKSDIRWWKLTNARGTGIKVYSDAPFSASALNYTNEDLDDFDSKDQRHSSELVEKDFTVLSIDLKQMGLGGINSWKAQPIEKYRIPYDHYEFTFVIERVE